MDTFVFSLVKVYGGRDNGAMALELANRGVDMAKLRYPEFLEYHEIYRKDGASDGTSDGTSERASDEASDGTSYLSLVQLVVITLMFWVAFFHRKQYEGSLEPGSKEPGSLKQGSLEPGECGLAGSLPAAPPSAEAVEEVIASVMEKILDGLGFDKYTVDHLDYEELERRVAGKTRGDFKDDGLFRAVAGAVAEAGPWDVSMDMVARRSGLSKSGLYAHFKNRQDMIRQFFETEFDRIFISAEAVKSESDAPEEQLYLTIIAIADYLRSRPEILFAVDRIRTRKLDLGVSAPFHLYRAFAGINTEIFRDDDSGTESDHTQTRERVSQWILFLIVNTLMRWSQEHSSGEEGPGYIPRNTDFTGVKNSCFRILYRFIVLGIEGFKGKGVDQ
jgi:AcrR family transcriptional regulator